MANNIIKRLWNQNRMVNIEDLSGMAFQAEAGGHTFKIAGTDDEGSAVSLSGTVSGVFMRPDGTDIALTGSISGGVASVTLTSACYAVPGRFGLTVFVTVDSETTAIYAAIGTVARSSTGTVAGDTPGDVVDLINAIAAAVATIPPSYTDLMANIAPLYSTSAVYAVGDYAWYDGSLYKCIVPITSGESWTAAHWASVVLTNGIKDDLNKKAPVIINTASGEVAHFTDGADGLPFKSILASILPIQNLHGYNKPWAPGAGVNKAFWPTLTNTSNNGVDYSISDDLDTLHIEGTASSQSTAWASGQSSTYADMPIGPLPAGTYTITVNGFVGQNASDRIVFTARYTDGTTISGANSQRLTSDSGVIPTGTGRTVTFTASDSFKIGLYLYISSGTEIDCDVKIQLEAASTLGSWTPYSNVCLITGRTSANVPRTGKNLCRVARGWSSSGSIAYTENEDGTVHVEGTATAESFSAGSITGSVSNIDSRCMYTVPAGTYTISNIAGVRIWVQFRNADNTANTATAANVAVGSSKTVTFTEPAIIYIRADIATGTVVDTDMQVMVTEGSTAATVYEPWKMQTVAADWASVAGTVYGGSFDPVTGALLSTMANIASYNGETIGEPWLSSLDEYAPGATPTTGAQVVYTLAAPLEYQLTPQEIDTLFCGNSVWSDSGSVSVEYPADTKLYIDQKIMALAAQILNG